MSVVCGEKYVVFIDFTLSVLLSAAWWFIGRGQRGGHGRPSMSYVKMRHRKCVLVSKVKGHPCVFSLPGPPEAGKSVSKEGMARQSDRRAGRPEVTPLSKLSARRRSEVYYVLRESSLHQELRSEFPPMILSS